MTANDDPKADALAAYLAFCSDLNALLTSRDIVQIRAAGDLINAQAHARRWATCIDAGWTAQEINAAYEAWFHVEQRTKGKTKNEQ